MLRYIPNVRPRVTFSEVVGAGFLITLYALVIAGIASSYGCATKVQGGQARHETGMLTIDHFANGQIRITDSRQLVQTTQPSVTTNARATPKTSSADEGEIGGVSFEQIKQTLADKHSWPLGLIFLVVAVASWYLGQPIFAAAAVAIGVLAILYPPILGIACAAVVIGVAYVAMRHWSQVKGAFTKVPASDNVKAIIRQHTDLRVQKALGV